MKKSKLNVLNCKVPECSESFNNRMTRKRHMDSEHPDFAPPVPYVNKFDKDEAGYKCHM